MRVGVDIGGTFTDTVGFDEATGTVLLGKSPSTADDLTHGIMDGLASVTGELPDVRLMIHGSTVVINALIERRGVKAALVTTKGFRDVYEIGRINRPDSFDPHFERHRPLIPRELIYEVNERLLADGSVQVPFDEEGAQAIAREIVAAGVRAVAVVLLHSYRSPEHELRMVEILKNVDPTLYVSASHELSREYREYERTSTTSANVYVGPIVDQYLSRLERRLAEGGFGGNLMIMQSNGGLCNVEAARQQSVQMIESGPAGGVVGAMALCHDLDIGAAVAFDMGGTTAKACVVQRGEPSYSTDYYVGGYARGLVLRVPVLEIVEVGTGGGSVAWLDASGQVHVGPRSAGSTPGPACYGRGGSEPTITDANLVLGRIDPATRMAGDIALDRDAAARALDQTLASKLHTSVERSALGILEVANAAMANSVRNVTLQRGLDPRDFVLVAYGGGGPLHGCAVARQLGMKTVVIPPSPGHFSAIGMLMADVRRDFTQTLFIRLEHADPATLREPLLRLADDARSALRRAGFDDSAIETSYAGDFRYVGQEHSVTVPIVGLDDPSKDGHILAGIKSRFDAAHEVRFGHSAPNEQAELVSLRASAVVIMPKPQAAVIGGGGTEPDKQAQLGTRRVVFEGSPPVEARVFERSRLLAGNVILGPALIQEAASTTVVAPGDTAEVDAAGRLRLTLAV